MKKTINSLSRVFLCLVCTAIAAFASPTVQAQQTYDIVHQVQADQTLQIKTQVQYQGSVIADGAGQLENARVVPLDARGQLVFDQRISDSSSGDAQAIRYFETASATIKTGQARLESKLGENNRLLLSRIKTSEDGNQQFQVASIAGAIRQKEYELLKNPGDPLSFVNVFNKTGVKVGEKWEIGKPELASLLSYDRIVSNSVTMMLKAVESNIAKVYIFGKAKGEVDDVQSEVTVKAIAQFDLTQKLVSSIRISIDEERRPGAFAPGFEGKIKLDTQVARAVPNANLSKERLAQLYQGRKIKFSFLFDRPNSEFQLMHDTDWRVIASEDDEIVLRYIEDGDLVAQCNVTELPKRPDGNPLALSQFQEEVRRIIAQKEARIIDSQRTVTSAGYETLKVQVDGVESNIPFIWNYYHIAATDGRRLSMIFTVEKDAADLLGTADQELMNRLVFKAVRQAATPNSSAGQMNRR